MLYNVALVSAVKQCESALCEHISPLHPPLACCSPRGRKESDRTGQLNNNNKSPPSQASLPALPTSHPSRSSQTTWLSSLCYAHGCVYMSGLPSRGFSGGTSVKNPPANPGDVRDAGQEVLWRRAWQPTPVSLPEESYGQRGLWATVHEVTKSRI